ncbi:MAG: hypothetical protein ABJA02_11875 [Acidobacteriota bacterium]
MMRSSLSSRKVLVQRFGRWLPLVLAAVCIGLCFLNWSRLSGLEYGYLYGVFNDPPSNGFVANGPNHFQSMNIWYVVIITCLSLYVVGFYLGSRRGASVIRLLALCVTIFPYYNMLDYKFYLRDSWIRYDWIESSFYIDIGCAVVLLGLLAKEILFAIRSVGSITEIPLNAVE